MTAPAKLTVFRTIVVNAPQALAFEVFTRRFDRWWPREHHIAPEELRDVVIEPRVGGRWLERGVNGGECEWGRVLVWDPPQRLVLSWLLSGEFQIESDPAKSSEVDVRFIREAADRTRVEVEHRHLERHTAGEQLHGQVSAEGGWGTLLLLYATQVDAAQATKSD